MAKLMKNGVACVPAPDNCNDRLLNFRYDVSIFVASVCIAAPSVAFVSSHI